MKKIYISLAIVMATQITFNAFAMKTQASDPVAGHKDKRRKGTEVPAVLSKEEETEFIADVESGTMDKLFLQQYDELRKIENPTREDIAAQSSVKEILCGILGYRFNRNGEPVKKIDGKHVAIVMNEPDKREAVATIASKEKRSSTSSE